MANNTKNIYLIGSPSAQINTCKLPTTRQVLQLLFHHHYQGKTTIRKSAVLTIREVQLFWTQAKIPTCREQYATLKLEKLRNVWNRLQKNRLRKNSRAQQIKEISFKQKLDSVFHIGSNNVMKTLSNEQRLLFATERILRRQGNRSQSSSATTENDSVIKSKKKKPDENISGQDDDNPKDFDHREATRESQDDIIDNETQELSQTLSQLSVSSIDSNQSHGIKRTISNFEAELDQPSSSTPRKKVITDQISATCDRVGLSSRNAMHVIGAVLQSLGHDVAEYSISHLTIHRKRIEYRAKMAAQLKNNLHAANFLVLHWDTKLLPNIDGNGQVDRLPVVITGLDTEQLLGVPALDTGSGINASKAIIECLNEWNLMPRVKALCFDTTSSNTGRENGTCHLLEKHLNKTFLHLACRHHIAEIILRNVVETYWKGTSGPNVAIFQRFKKEWDNFDKTQYKTGMDDPTVADILRETRENILEFIFEQFQILSGNEE